MDFTELPTRLPILSLYGGVIFSDTILPIPMSNVQYEVLLSVVDSVDCLIGIVQPIHTEYEQSRLPLFHSGTVAQVIGASELDENTVVVQFKGLCRFVIEEEIYDHNSFRYARVSYNKYIYADSLPCSLESFDKEAFVSLARNFMKKHDVSPNWNELINISEIELMNYITMIGPFEACEKQAVLELTNPNEQKKLLEKIMSMSVQNSGVLSYLVH